MAGARFKYKTKIMDVQKPEGQVTHNMKQMYEFFCKLHPDEDIPFILFRETITRYNKMLLERILNGEKVMLGSGLGAIVILKNKRSFNKRMIDWGETNRLKREEGINKYVYFTDDTWVKFYWHRLSKIGNRSVYRFVPTKGCRGITVELAKRIKQNPFLLDQISYREYPEEKRAKSKNIK